MITVIGTNNATKQLAQFLDCTKEYRAIGLLGCSTDSYDSEGKRVRMAPYEHVTEDKIKTVLAQFRGEIEQIPPMRARRASTWSDHLLTCETLQLLGTEDGR